MHPLGVSKYSLKEYLLCPKCCWIIVADVYKKDSKSVAKVVTIDGKIKIVDVCWNCNTANLRRVYLDRDYLKHSSDKILTKDDVMEIVLIHE